MIMFMFIFRSTVLLNFDFFNLFLTLCFVIVTQIVFFLFTSFFYINIYNHCFIFLLLFTLFDSIVYWNKRKRIRIQILYDTILYLRLIRRFVVIQWFRNINCIFFDCIYIYIDRIESNRIVFFSWWNRIRFILHFDYFPTVVFLVTDLILCENERKWNFQTINFLLCV